MKKLLGILVLGLLLSGNAYAEKIIFSDCASKKDNFIFNPKIWEKNEIIIDTSKKTVSRILIKSDEFFIHGFLLCVEKMKFFSSLKNYLPEKLNILFTCFIVFNLWIVFRISDFNTLKLFFDILYSSGLAIYGTKALFALIILLLGLFSQKYDNYNFIEKSSQKINFKLLIPFGISIILSGLLLSLGTSEKFIYFDF